MWICPMSALQVCFGSHSKKGLPYSRMRVSCFTKISDLCFAKGGACKQS